MRELSSTWVARHWAATADLASREPIVVANHRRSRVVVMDEALAKRFFAWLGTQPEIPHPLGEAVAESLASQKQRERDEFIAHKTAEFRATPASERVWTEENLALLFGYADDYYEEHPPNREGDQKG